MEELFRTVSLNDGDDTNFVHFVSLPVLFVDVSDGR